MRQLKNNFGLFYQSLQEYKAPSILNYHYNYGSYALMTLGLQIITGIFLVMSYSTNAATAFLSIEHIMRDVPLGWFVRYLHANGASLFFFLVYLHLFRGLLLQSFIYPRRALWCSGIIILLLMILTSFLGYVLPWAQMSYWAAIVITNLASSVPFYGQKIVYWLWSGFSVDQPTLSKFFALHYLLPFIIVGLVLIHLFLLHKASSNNPLGFKMYNDTLPLNPYFSVKDFLGIIIILTILTFLVCFVPNTLGHPDNYIPANPDLTPEHIVPEWYFLPFYAILRSIPNKSIGILLLLSSILVLFILPFINRPKIRGCGYKPLVNILTLCFIANCLILGYIGQSPLEQPFLELGWLATIFYFAYFLLLPLCETVDGYMVRIYISVSTFRVPMIIFIK